MSYKCDCTPWCKGYYLLDEEIWMDAGIFLGNQSYYDLSQHEPYEFISDEEIVGLVDKAINRIMK